MVAVDFTVSGHQAARSSARSSFHGPDSLKSPKAPGQGVEVWVLDMNASFLSEQKIRSKEVPLCLTNRIFARQQGTVLAKGGARLRV